MKKPKEIRLVKVPDNKVDRDKLIENLKKDLEESLEKPESLDRLAELAKVLMKIKKGKK